MPEWRAEIRGLLANCNLDPGQEAAIVDELADHADQRYEELLRQGWTPAKAYQRTLAELSDARLPEGVLGVESTPKALLSRRFPFAARILFKYWRLTGVAVLSLAIAMAAAVGGLSFTNALLLRPPTAFAPGQLVTIHESSPSGEFQQASFAEYKLYRDQNQVFSGVAAFNYGIGVTPFGWGKQSGNAVSGSVSVNYFDVLGVHSAVGRFFSAEDSIAKEEAVLSYPFWQRLGGDTTIVGQRLRWGGGSLTIVGVAPKDFTGTVIGFSNDVWTNITRGATPEELNRRDNRWLTPVARLKPGISRGQAESDVKKLAQNLAQDFPASNEGYTANVRPLTMLNPGDLELARTFSWTVMGVVFLVLLAACANGINLLLGLAAARRQEMLIRAALGATRGRLIRQLLQESALICLFSSLLGFSLAWYGLKQLLAFRPVLFSGLPPLLLDFRPDLRVAGLTAALILLLTAAIGLIPALHLSISDLAAALNGEMVVGGTGKRRARSVLVIIQTAVCSLVLVGAGLCLRSIEYLKQVPLGFSARNLVFTFTGVGVEKPAQFYANVRRETASLPGVTAVSLSTSLPLTQNGPPDVVVPEGNESSKDQWSAVSYNIIDNNYFSVLGLPLLAGRPFDSTDAEHSPEVAVINRTLARKYWPSQDPLGKRLRIRNGNRLVQIVGVVGDSKYGDLDEPELSFMYLALSQHPGEADGLALTVATNGQPRQWIEPILNRIHKVNPEVFCMMTGTLEDQVNLSLLLPRIIFGCVSGFGLLALVLSMSGIYATTSYSVGERKKEIGIRMALGATPGDVMTVLLRQSALATMAGLILGLGLGVALSALLRSLLYGIRPVETGVLIAVFALTTTLALATAYSAARPWVTADPLEAVRHA
jgi:putative ABC transport system permease protein